MLRGLRATEMGTDKVAPLSIRRGPRASTFPPPSTAPVAPLQEIRRDLTRPLGARMVSGGGRARLRPSLLQGRLGRSLALPHGSAGASPSHPQNRRVHHGRGAGFSVAAPLPCWYAFR